MTVVFLAVLKMSLSASVAALVVMLARLCLRKAPKIFSYVLWAAVLFRMVCPFGIPVYVNGLTELTLISQYSGITALDTYSKTNGNIESVYTVNPEDIPVEQTFSDSEKQYYYTVTADTADITHDTGTSERYKMTAVLVYLWISVLAFMMSYFFITYIRLSYKLKTAIWSSGNIYESDLIYSGFVLGIFRPRIYIPSGLSEKEKKYVIMHERMHIRRGDYLIKYISFLALSIHWFNPVIWLSYVLMCGDMESSCDETVIKALSGNSAFAETIKKEYGMTLLSLAGKLGTAAPVSFAGNSIEERMKNIMRFRKRSAYSIICFTVVCALIMSACVSTPRDSRSAEYMSVTDTTSEVPAGQASVVLMLSDISTEGYESYPQNSWEVFFRSVSGVSYLTADTVEDENTGRFRKLIYTAGKNSDQFIPLCGKPGCGHDSPDCDAYITSDTFGFYDNKIFYAGDFADGVFICRMNMDGSYHCIINTVILEDDSLYKDSLEGSYVYRYLFDNGYVYFAVDHDPGEAELFRIKLEEGAKREYYNIEGIDDLRTIFVPVNGVVYFDLPSREGVPKTYRCTVDAPPVVMNSAIMHDGTIKGYEFTEDRVSYYKCGAGITDGFYEADTITGEEKLIKEFSMTLPYGHAVYQGQYIYLEELIPDQTEYADHQNDQHFYVFDRNYEMIASSVIPFEHKRQYPAFMAATDDRMLFSIHLFPQKYDYYIDKSDIASGNIISDIASGNIIWREAA